MAAARSAGLLVWRRGPDGVEVLIGHMGGPYWAGKDDGGWSIPKGEHDPDAMGASMQGARVFWLVMSLLHGTAGSASTFVAQYTVKEQVARRAIMYTQQSSAQRMGCRLRRLHMPDQRRQCRKAHVRRNPPLSREDSWA